MKHPTNLAIGPTAYDVTVPSSVAFGAGRFRELGGIAARFGRHAWLVTGSRSLGACGGMEAVESVLAAAGLSCGLIATARGEPTLADVAEGVRHLASSGKAGGVVVAIGGGSAIDLAKAIAALATNVEPAAAIDEEVVTDHLEGVGRGLVITRPPVPVVAVPTTAGTGAEATRNAVISCQRRRFKKSMRSPLMVPRAALIDPSLTATCPRDVTAASGLDAITQLVESFVSRARAPLPQALVLDALPRAVAALPRVLANPGDLDARAAMSHAAFVSGVALANSGLGMAHGVAAALGVECGTPHGVACALLLPVAVTVNRPVCRDDFALLERAIEPSAVGGTDAAADAFVSRIERLCAEAGTPRRLSDVGLDRDRLSWLADNSGGGSMRGNPVALDSAALRPILEGIW